MPVSTEKLPSSLIPGVSISIASQSNFINCRYVVACLPLLSFSLTVFVANIDSPIRLFNKVVLPTPEDPNKQYVCRGAKRSFMFFKPDSFSLLNGCTCKKGIILWISAILFAMSSASRRSLLLNNTIGFDIAFFNHH